MNPAGPWPRLSSPSTPKVRGGGQPTNAFVTDTSANEVIKQALTEYLKAYAKTDMVRAAFERVLQQHSVAFEKLEHL